MSEDVIDDFTIHCVERIIKDLIIQNEKYQENVMDTTHFRELEYLIFENRKLVLYEVLGKVQNLNITRKKLNQSKMSKKRRIV